jgi:electron transfer flavoprotein beta subunit
MRLLVFLGLGADVRIPPERDPRSGRVREEWLVRETDPASACALDLALRLKAARPGTEVTLVHLGAPSTEPWLRQALARGGDRGIRIWDDEAAGARVVGKAVILAAAAQVAGFDLALTGAAGVIDAGGQLGVLLAAQLGVPCVTQVVDITLRDGTGRVEIVRALDRGFRERVEALLPVVATVSAGGPGAEDAALPGTSIAALLAARAREIPVWDLADLGVPFDAVRRADGSLRCGPPCPRHSRLHPIAAPDPRLPAFERILKLVQGAVQRREGRIVRQPAEATVDEIFRTLRDEGWLDHLRAGGGRGAAGSEAAGPGSAEGLEAGDHP